LNPEFSAKGGCACGGVRFRLEAKPLIVHACHCRWCQRETGSAFALNAMIESEHLCVTAGATQSVDTPSNSGKGQKIHRCPACKVALWSHYAGGGAALSFVRVGCLDNPDQFPPDVHIFTSTKQPWFEPTDGKPVMQEYYRAKELWPAESLARMRALNERRRRHTVLPGVESGE